MKKDKVLFIDGLNDISIIRKIHRTNYVNYDFLLFASSFDKEKSSIKYYDNRDINIENLLIIIKDFSPNIIFISVNFHNFKTIPHLNLDNKKSSIYLVLKDKFILKIFQKSNFNVVTYEDSSPILDQLSRLPLFNEIKHILKEKTKQIMDIDLVDISNKKATITTGYKCVDKHKSFFKYRNIALIEQELLDLFNTGEKYFHVNNESIIFDEDHLNQMITLLNRLIEKKEFVWSLEGSVEGLARLVNSEYQKLNLCGLERIEILYSNKDVISQHNSNFPFFKNQAYELINSLLISNITSISVNIIIKLNEDDASIRSLKSFMKKTYDKAQGQIEFDFDFEVSQNDGDVADYYEILNSTLLEYEPFAHKESPLYYKQIKLKEELEKYDLKLIEKSIPKMTFKQRYKHLDININSIQTKYYYYFLRKSYTKDVFNISKNNEHVKFSWEIPDLSSFSPIIIGKYSMSEKNEKVIFFDRLISSQNENLLLLNDIEIDLIEITQKKHTLEAIVLIMEKKHKVSKKTIMSFYNKLEQNDSLCYIKFL